jgi:hypothetical protein
MLESPRCHSTLHKHSTSLLALQSPAQSTRNALFDFSYSSLSIAVPSPNSNHHHLHLISIQIDTLPPCTVNSPLTSMPPKRKDRTPEGGKSKRVRPMHPGRTQQHRSPAISIGSAENSADDIERNTLIIESSSDEVCGPQNLKLRRVLTTNRMSAMIPLTTRLPPQTECQ